MNNASLELGGDNWAAKDTKLLASTVSDDSGRFYPREFTFTRGSNLSATRVNENSLIEKGRENLLLQSNQFDTTWVTPDATITSGQADKDGGNNAWLLTATSAFNRVAQPVSQSGVKRFSVYAKANTNDYLLLGSVEGAHFYATFNLATGAVDSNNINAISPSIENVGNGWYRCSATWVGTTTEVRIASQVTGGQDGWASTTSGSIYIQDAQLEVGLGATGYIETGASAAKAGILENEPRIDYSSGAPSLLLEPSRTNLVYKSEYYNVYWNKTAISVTNNATTSPEGLQNASKLIPSNGAGGNRSISKSFLSLTGLHTFSIYAKAAEYKYISLRLRNSPSAFAMFDLTNGLVHAANTNSQMVSGSPKIEPVGTDGWYRCSVVLDPSGSIATGQLSISYSVGITGDETNNFSGDGVSGIYIYGAQFEAGSYPTSYIPNHSEGSVTRGVDSCSVTGVSSLIGQSEGTLYAEIQGNANALSGNTFLSLTESTGNNRIIFGQSSNANQVRFYIDVDAYASGHNYNVTDITQPQKLAIVYYNSGNNIALYLNGVQKSIFATSDTFSASLTEIAFDNGMGGQAAEFNVKELIVLDSALTQSEAEALTTL
jgi:hypothetical protein